MRCVGQLGRDPGDRLDVPEGTEVFELESEYHTQTIGRMRVSERLSAICVQNLRRSA